LKRTFSVLVENKRGVLSKISGLFAQRGFNITSLAVGETENQKVSRITIVVDGDEQVLDQVYRQLNRKVNVIKVEDFSGLPEDDLIISEHVFVRIRCGQKNRGSLLQIIDSYKGTVRSIHRQHVIVEIIGDLGKIKSFTDLMEEEYGIIETVRSGPSAISRSKILTLEKKKKTKKTTKKKKKK